MSLESELSTSLALFLTYRSVWLIGWIGLLMIFENRFPLRQMKRTDRAQAWVRNIGLGAITEVTQRWVAAPLLGAIVSAAFLRTPFLSTTLDELIPAKMPIAGAGVVSLVLLDGVLYAWHRMNHRIPVLWRFHRVHHADPDMDSTTAIRFHFGEFFFSNLYRAGQITLIGVPPEVLGLFELIVTFAAIFHHSNFRLPARLDRILSACIATPRIHSIHHSVLESETRSNYGSLLLVWDRLHRSLNTRRINTVDEIEIGDKPWSEPRFRGLVATLLLPFKRERSLEA